MELIQSKGERAFGHILVFDLRNFDLNSSVITLHTFGELVNVSLPTAKNVGEFHSFDDCVNFKVLETPPFAKFTSGFRKDNHLIREILLYYKSGKPFFSEFI